MRQEAADKLGVNSTPSFFVDGKKFDGEPTVDGFRAILKSATAPAKAY